MVVLVDYYRSLLLVISRLIGLQWSVTVKIINSSYSPWWLFGEDFEGVHVS